MRIRIIDKRRKEKFIIDDEYLNGQAKLCGWQATLVYISLCRHVNREQECFPSIQLMSEELSVSRDTIMKGIKNLEKRNVIRIQKCRNSKSGKWLNNLYILLDKSEWDYSHVGESDTDHVGESVNPCRSQRKTKSVSPTLRKHIEGNTYKDSNLTERQKKWRDKYGVLPID